MIDRRRLLPVLLCIGLVTSGCELMATAVVPTGTPGPAASATSDATPRARRTPRASDAALTPDPGAVATPRPTRRPRPSASATPVPTPTPTPRPPRTPMPPIPGVERLTGRDGRLTVLVLGSDARERVVGERTDTIMVVTIDPSTGRVAMASLPRDTVNVPIGDGQVYASPARINGLFQHFRSRGADRAEALRRTTRAIAYAFDIEIDHHVLIGFRGVQRLVERIGGVDVKLAQPLHDRSMHRISRRGLRLRAGVNHLNGKRALAFARTRYTDSDYHRSARQQQLLAAITRKVVANGVDAIPALAELALRNVETDIPLDAWPLLAELAGRARLGNYRGIVLAPATYASAGPVLYTIQLNVPVVRSTLRRHFGPVS